MDVQVIDLPLDSGERFSSVRRPLGMEAMGATLINLEPRQRGRIHRHREQEELYVVLAGELTIALEDGEVKVGPMQAAFVPPRVRRQLANAGGERVSVLALGAAGEHRSRDGEAFADWSETEGRPPQEVPQPDDLPG